MKKPRENPEKIPQNLRQNLHHRPNEAVHTDVFVSEVNQVIEEAVAMVTALLRPIDARAVNHVTVHDRRWDVGWYTNTQN